MKASPPGDGPPSLLTAPRVCSACGMSTWLESHCNGSPVVDATVHLARESATRKGAFHLICRASMRGDGFKVLEVDAAAANCPDCLAILAREARAAA